MLSLDEERREFQSHPRWAKPAIYSNDGPCKGGVGSVGTDPLMAGYGLVFSGARSVPCQRVSARYFEASHRGKGIQAFSRFLAEPPRGE